MSQIGVRQNRTVRIHATPHRAGKRAMAAAGLLLLGGCANIAWNDAQPRKRGFFARAMPDEIFTIPAAGALGAGGNNGAAFGNPIAGAFGLLVGIVEFPFCWIREMVTGESPSNRDLVRAIDKNVNGK